MYVSMHVCMYIYIYIYICICTCNDVCKRKSINIERCMRAGCRQRFLAEYSFASCGCIDNFSVDTKRQSSGSSHLCGYMIL